MPFSCHLFLFFFLRSLLLPSTPPLQKQQVCSSRVLPAPTVNYYAQATYSMLTTYPSLFLHSSRKPAYFKGRDYKESHSPSSGERRYLTLHKILPQWLGQVGVLGMKAGRADLFSTSAPCTPHSVAGTGCLRGPVSSAASTAPLPVQRMNPCPTQCPEQSHSHLRGPTSGWRKWNFRSLQEST